MIIRKCTECGAEFKGHHNKKTCSDECRKTRIRRKNAGYMKKYPKEKRNEWARKCRETKPWKYHSPAIRNRCKKRGIRYTLTEKWFRENYERGCAVTGIAFKVGEGVVSPFSPSVDRLDQSKGYTPANCRMVLQGVNALRGNGTDKDMRRIAWAIVKKKGGDI